MYIVSRIQITKANVSKDGKEHRHTVYYAGTDNFGGFGVDTWSKRKDAYKFIYKQTAERVARSNGGKVIEVD